MSQTTGSVVSVGIAGTTFPVTADSDPTRDLAGYTKELMMNGDGSSRIKMTRKPWAIKGLTVALDDISNTQEFMQNLINSPDGYPVVITYADNSKYSSGKGHITGDLSKSAQNGTADIEIMGDGIDPLVKQA